MHRVLTWLRLLYAYSVLTFFVLSSQYGCNRNQNPATHALPTTHVDWWDRHEAKVAEAKRRAGAVDLLFVGDSITQNYEQGLPQPELNYLPIWEELFATHRAMNLGFSRDRTYNVLWRLRHGEVDGLAPKDIVLLIGTNNFSPSWMEPGAETAAEVADGIIAVVEDLHKRIPAARILVLSILPSNIWPERSAKANATNAAVERRLSHIVYARYLDVTAIFLDGDRVRDELYSDALLSAGMPALHPAAAGQRMMAEAVSKALYSAQR